MSDDLTPRPKFAPSPVERRRRRDIQIQRIVRQIRRNAPWTEGIAYTPLLRRFAELCLLAERAYATLRDANLLNGQGELRSSLNYLPPNPWTSRSLARELGLSPTVAETLAPRAKILDLESIRNVSEKDE